MTENKRWIFALPLIFILHDLEELITLEKFQTDVLSSITARYEHIPQISVQQFSAAVSLLAVGIFIIIFLLFKRPSSTFSRNILLWLLWILWINSLTHILQTLYFGEYVPGLISAIFCQLPFTTIFILKLHKTENGNIKFNPGIFIIALVSTPPVILLSLQFGKMVVHLFGG